MKNDIKNNQDYIKDNIIKLDLQNQNIKNLEILKNDVKQQKNDIEIVQKDIQFIKSDIETNTSKNKKLQDQADLVDSQIVLMKNDIITNNNQIKQIVTEIKLNDNDILQLQIKATNNQTAIREITQNQQTNQQEQPQDGEQNQEVQQQDENSGQTNQEQNSQSTIQKVEILYKLAQNQLLLPQQAFQEIERNGKVYNQLMQNQKNDKHIYFQDMQFYQTLEPYGNDEIFFAGLNLWFDKCNNLNPCELLFEFKKYKTDDEFKFASFKNMYLTQEGNKFQLHWDIESSYIGNEDKFDSQLTYDLSKVTQYRHNRLYWTTQDLDLDNYTYNCANYVHNAGPFFFDSCFQASPFGKYGGIYGIIFNPQNQNYQQLEYLRILVRNY